MAKLTDARVATLKGHFNAGDQPLESNFADLIQYIQEGIEEHDHSGTGDGDGVSDLVGPLTGVGLTVPDGWYLGIGAGSERIEFDSAGDITILGANFGINEPAPTEYLHITENNAALPGPNIMLESNHSGGTQDMGGVIFSLAATDVGSIVTRELANNEYALNFRTWGASAGSALTTKMVLLGGGKLGLGTTIPESFVDISRSNAVPDVSIICYDDDAAEARLYFRKSDTDTIGSQVETDTDDWLGLLGFQGVNSGGSWGYGVYMHAIQRAAAGVAYVAAALITTTYSSAGSNANHMVLDGLTGHTGFNVAAGSTAGKVHIDQSVNDAAIPVLVLDQADVSEGAINFIASDRGVITGATNSLESIRVEVNGVVRRIACYADA